MPKLSDAQHRILSRLYLGHRLFDYIGLSSSTDWAEGGKANCNSARALVSKGYVDRSERGRNKYEFLITDKGRQAIEEIGPYVPVIVDEKDFPPEP